MSDQIPQQLTTAPQPIHVALTGAEWEWVIALVQKEADNLRGCLAGTSGREWRMELLALEQKLKAAPMTDPVRNQRSAALDALVEDVKNTCGIVYAQLTDQERDGTPEERIKMAANEVRELHRRTEARVLFSEAGL